MIQEAYYPRYDREQAAKTFGEIKDGKWPKASQWCTVYHPPVEITRVLGNSMTGFPATAIYVNRCMIRALDLAFRNVVDRGLVSELKTYDGCFNVRDVRGKPGVFSWHSYALAIDLNAKENGLGQTPTFSPEFVACFTDEGFEWGGDFARLDGMHFQYGRD